MIELELRLSKIRSELFIDQSCELVNNRLNFKLMMIKSRSEFQFDYLKFKLQGLDMLKCLDKYSEREQEFIKQELKIFL